ncbi:hypothetical protein ACA910_008714 [Epithemia clementina (nom. ined.)]
MTFLLGQFVCCPYGLFFAAPFSLAVLALAFTFYATMSCDYFKVDYENSGIFRSAQVSSFTVGPWTVEEFKLDSGLAVDTGDCVFWGDHETLDTGDLDWPLQFARYVLLAACGPAILATCCFSFGNCCILWRSMLRFFTCSFFAYGILTPISLIALLSDWCRDAATCKAGWPAISSIIAFVFWFASGLSIMLLKVREIDDKGTDDEGEDEEHDRRHDVEDDDDNDNENSDNDNDNDENNDNQRALENEDANDNDQQEEQPSNVVATAAKTKPASPTTTVSEQTVEEDDGTLVKITTTTVISADGVKKVSTEREVIKEGRQQTKAIVQKSRQQEKRDDHEQMIVPRNEAKDDVSTLLMAPCCGIGEWS